MIFIIEQTLTNLTHFWNSLFNYSTPISIRPVYDSLFLCRNILLSKLYSFVHFDLICIKPELRADSPYTHSNHIEVMRVMTLAHDVHFICLMSALRSIFKRNNL